MINERFIDGLYEEYNLLQNKIDKIADFELKVRGWCITLESALIAGLISEKLSNGSIYYVTCFLIFIILVFQFLEQEQLETKKILSSRALDVEKAINRLIIDKPEESEKKRRAINEGVIKQLKGTPGTSIALRNNSRNRTKLAFQNMFTFKNHIFYYAQYMLIFAVIVIASIHFLDDMNVSKSTINQALTEKPCLIAL